MFPLLTIYLALLTPADAVKLLLSVILFLNSASYLPFSSLLRILSIPYISFGWAGDD